DHHYGRPGGLKAARDEAEVCFVEAVPVAAVDEDVDGRPRRARGWKDVQSLALARAIRHIEAAGEGRPRRGALARVAREPVRRVLDLRAVVVLPVQRLAVILAED